MSADEQMQFWKDEFWKGLNRLYDETLVLRDEIADLRKTIEAHSGQIADLRDGAADLLKIAEAHQRAIETHQHVINSHEKRGDRLDVLVEWLAEKERAREQHP